MQDEFFDSLVSTLGIVNQCSFNSKKHFHLSADSTNPNARNRGTFLNLENFSFFLFFEILKIIAGMLPLTHCGDEKDWCIELSSWLYCVCIVLLALC